MNRFAIKPYLVPGARFQLAHPYGRCVLSAVCLAFHHHGIFMRSISVFLLRVTVWTKKAKVVYFVVEAVTIYMIYFENKLSIIPFIPR